MGSLDYAGQLIVDKKTVNSDGVFVTRIDKDHYAVRSNICPHLSCWVSWSADTQEYVCPCQDALFSVSGEVTGGSSPVPLQVYETKIEAGNLFFHLLKG